MQFWVQLLVKLPSLLHNGVPREVMGQIFKDKFNGTFFKRQKLFYYFDFSSHIYHDSDGAFEKIKFS